MSYLLCYAMYAHKYQAIRNARLTDQGSLQLLLSSFVLPYAFGTLLLAPISEMVGRRPVLLLSAVVFLTFTIACGVAQSSAQFVVFRVLAGLGGCVPLAVGVAMIGDLYAPHERGSAMALYMFLQLGGPVVSLLGKILSRPNFALS